MAVVTSDPLQPERCNPRPAKLRSNAFSRKEEQHLRDRVARHRAEGRHRKANALERMLRANLYCKRGAIKRANRKVPSHLKLDAEQQFALATTMDLTKPSTEVVRLLAQPKSDGAMRPIHSAGVEVRAREDMLKRSMAPTITPAITDQQYSVTGKGRPKLMAQVAALLERKDANGKYLYTWIATADIKNAFGSLTNIVDYVVGKGLLPRKVAEMNISGRHRNLTIAPSTRKALEAACAANDTSKMPCPGTLAYHQWRERRKAASYALAKWDMESPIWDTINKDIHDTVNSFLNAAAAGCAQGSALSSLLLELAIADVLAVIDLPDGTIILVYADDVVVLSRSKRDVEAALQTLGASLRLSPAGHLEIGRKQVARVCDGISYLGYHLRRRCDKVEFRPITKRLKSIGEKLGKSLRLIADGNENERPRFRRIVRSWRRAFAEADLYDTLMDALEFARTLVPQMRAKEMLTGLMREVAAHVHPRPKRRLWSTINAMI
ncbi:MAG: hypothetical protein L0210_10865 [Rhodospirillales bacterium]|nr:hypothetical protein [Rhodospirillales bacterium]